MYPKKSVNLLILLLLFCTACSTSAENLAASTSVPTPASLVTQPTPTQDISGLTVISGYLGQAEYISAAKANPDGDFVSLYQEYVLDRYWSQCAQGGEYMGEKEEYATSIRDLEQLEQMTQVLINSDVETLLEETYVQSNLHLPSEETTICVFAVDPDYLFVRDQMNGVYGFTAGAGKIWLEIYPEGNWEEWIGYAVAHEYHHSVWTAKYHAQKAPTYLVDYLVFEGRADSFAHQLYPELMAPWVTALSEEEEIRQWETIQGILKLTSRESIQSYMGGGQRNIPLWAGYTIGFHIVQELIEKHPELSVEDWTAMDAMGVLEQSGYGAQE